MKGIIMSNFRPLYPCSIDDNPRIYNLEEVMGEVNNSPDGPIIIIKKPEGYTYCPAELAEPELLDDEPIEPIH